MTTYGLLRKDITFLREIESDYVILDEAQAIKNADSESAKAARLLRGSTTWRSRARRSRTTSASCGRCSSS